MTVVTRHVAAPPEAVWAVLADPERYAEWVVGAGATAPADAAWPEPGSTFVHRQLSRRIGPTDTTSVLACERARRLALEARLRPLGVAHVDLLLEPDGDGTRVTMRERAVDGPLARVPQRLLDAPVGLRNRRSLRRLAWMAEAGYDRDRRRGPPA